MNGTRQMEAKSSGKYRTHRLTRAISRYIGRKCLSKTVKRRQDTRVLVILHLFYMSAWKEIREYLKNLSPYNYSLIVTCTNGFCDEETLSQVLDFKSDARIIRRDNSGWDVLPFLVALQSVDLSDYDIVFKLQSKGTKRQEIYLYGQYFRKRGWFLNLFEGCIGPFTVHSAIDSLMDKEKGIGLVAAKNLIVEDPIHKKHFVEQTANELGLPFPEDYRFVAGSCFAVRANLLERIQKLDIEPERFGTKGFTYAHRLERLICFPPLWEGLKMTGPEVLKFRRSLWFFHPFAWWWKKYNGARMLKDSRVKVDDKLAFDYIEPRLIKSWDFINIRVGDIKRQLYPHDKTVIPLSETLPYKYLVTRDSNVYEEYCRYNQRTWNNNLMSRERFDELIRSLETNGDTRDKNIVLGDDNVIFDGQHRCCWLLYSNGPDYVINALQIKDYHPGLFSRALNSLQYRIPSAFRAVKRVIGIAE